MTQPAGKSQHFTDEEKEQLAKLREQLPDIIHEAEKQSKEPVSSSLWGVSLLDEDGSDARVDVILAKFLRARPNDLAAAGTMLTNTLKWRAEFKVDELMEEEFPELFKEVGYTYKRDKLGRPVTYNVYGGLDNKKVFGDLERFIRWRVQLMESGMRQLDFVDSSYMVQVHDYNGVGLFSFDKDARAASKATIQVLSDNYPESLAVKIFSYVPSWGETVFNIVGRWLSEETKKKFVVVSKASAEKTLAEIIGKENLPEKYGGLGNSESKESDAAKQPPTAEPAHANPEDDAPKPTDAPETGAIDEKADQIAQPAPTAAPEEDGVTGNTDGALASETAGMRIDDKAEESTKTEEPAKTEDPVPTATTAATTS